MTLIQLACLFAPAIKAKIDDDNAWVNLNDPDAFIPDALIPISSETLDDWFNDPPGNGGELIAASQAMYLARVYIAALAVE